MSLIRQIWLLLVVTVVLSLLASVTVGVASARETLQTQLRLKNADNAQALALALSQQHGDATLIDLLLAAQFDTGFYRRIAFTPSQGGAPTVRESAARASVAPAWFQHLTPIESLPGHALVSDGWRPLGSVEVVSHSSYAHDDLWRSATHSAFWLALVGLAAGVAASLAVRSIRRPLDATVAQANALVEGRFVRVIEPAIPELQRVAQAMNTMVERVRMLFESQATQVESLRRAAQCDTLTGLPHRKQFMSQLASALAREDGPVDGGLVLLRLCDLAELNQSLGHDTTDGAIQSLAQLLRAYPERGGGCFVGRLNGSDFALCLPVPGVARETAESLAQALRAALPAFGPRIRVALGAVEIRQSATVGALMSAVDAALARSESQDAFSVVLADPPVDGDVLRGQRSWRQQIADALNPSHARLVEFPVLDRRLRRVHLECPLRLQLQADGPFEVAGRWLPLAVRSKLTARVDELAVQLALEAIGRDGQERCVNVAPASLSDAGFAGVLRHKLQQWPQAARKLWIEVAESAAVEHFDWLQELGRQLRPLGVRFGLEHVGSHLAQIDRLYEAGLDYVKLDAASVVGLASDAHRAGHVTSIVAMLRGLSLQVMAEGVGDADDVQALWDCGVDAVTGPWASATSPIDPAA